MSAPTLSVAEQKEAISGKKKKKKTMKNVLGIPSSLKVESYFTEAHETEKLSKILERLLPSARLQVQQNDKSNTDSNKELTKESELKAESKSKRNQLSLGVNDLSRSIKKELISAVLLASDIKPKFLIHHLNLLCSHSKIPFLHMPGLRKITKNNLGFPCIAVGFKKNNCDFAEAVEEIKCISQTKKVVLNDTEQESAVESGTGESEEETSSGNLGKSDEIDFTYLVRSSTKERIFIPEKCHNSQTKAEADFIILTEDDSKSKVRNDQPSFGISSNLIRKRKTKFKDLEQLRDDDSDNDEVLEVPKKKVKKEWVIDKVGNRQNYYPANLRRVPSNPDRNRRK